MTGKGSESQDDDGRDAPVPGESSGSKRLSLHQSMAKSSVNLDEECFKNLPHEVMKIMELLDFDNSGTLNKDELQVNVQMLQDLRTAVHGDAEGNLSPEEFKETVDLLKRLTVAKKQDQSVMEYSHMPPKIQKVLAQWDVSKSGYVTEESLMGAAKAWTRMKKENRQIKKLLFAGLAAVLIMFVGTFAISWATIEMSKEFKQDSDRPHMVTRDGDTVQTASSDFEVTSTGVMVNRNTSTAKGRRLQGTCDSGTNCVEVGAAAIATRLSRQEAVLRSTIPDKYLREMTELMLDGADGGSITVQVSSAVRAVDPEAKCGSIVRVTTPHGAVTLDDTELYLPDGLVEHALELGVTLEFAATARYGYGRRLSSGQSIMAMFNFIENFEWKCESVPKPPPPPREFRSELSVQFSCFSDGGDQPCASQKQPGALKPGVVLGEDGEQRLEVPESLISGPTETISVISNPNHPLVRRVHIFDHAAKRKVSYRLFLGKQYSCTSEPADDSEDGTRDGTIMTFMGTVHQDGREFRKFGVMRTNTSVGTLASGKPAVRPAHVPADRQIVVWYESHAGGWRPAKVVPPGGKGGQSAITVFKNFLQTSDVRRLYAHPEGDRAERRLSDAPPLSHAGVEKIADLPRGCPTAADATEVLPAFTNAFTEDAETVNFYTGKLAELIEDEPAQLTMEEVALYYGQYWVKQLEDFFGEEERSEKEEQQEAQGGGGRRLAAQAEEEEDAGEAAAAGGGPGNSSLARQLSASGGWEINIPGSPSVKMGEKISGSSAGGICREIYAGTGNNIKPWPPFAWEAEGNIKMCQCRNAKGDNCGTSVEGTAKIGMGLSADILKKGCEDCDCVLSCSLMANAALSVGNYDTNNRRRDTGSHHRRRRGRATMKLTPSISGGCVIAWCALGVSAEGKLDFTFDPVGPCGDSNDWTSWQADWGLEACGYLGPFKACYSASGEIGSGWISSGRRRCARRRR